MKYKIFSLGLIVLILFSISACQKSNNQNLDHSNNISRDDIVSKQSSTEAKSEESKKIEISETTSENETTTSIINDMRGDISEDDKQSSKMEVAVYYLVNNGEFISQVRELHIIEKDKAVLKRSLEELISGEIKTKDAMRPIPESTRILGINIKDETAIINLSADLFEKNGEDAEYIIAALQAITNTMTEFLNIKSTRFIIESSEEETDKYFSIINTNHKQLFVRDMNRVMYPSIWFEMPKNGQLVDKSFKVSGSMLTFESTAGYRLEDENGKILDEGTITGNVQDGIRTLFEYDIKLDELDSKYAILSMFGFSGKDGSEVDKVSLKIYFK